MYIQSFRIIFNFAQLYRVSFILNWSTLIIECMVIFFGAILSQLRNKNMSRLLSQGQKKTTFR